jgi:AcrR family transcriptional regulator
MSRSSTVSASAGKRDLRTDILRIARELLEEGGVAALSMREVSRRAQCTHQAPYHHFGDRAAILAALAAEGFAQLGKRLVSANALAAAQGYDAALRASARAYVGFAREHTGVFRLMFQTHADNPLSSPELAAHGQAARAELTRLSAFIPGGDGDGTHAYVLWSFVHGLACLLVDGQLAASMGTGDGLWHRLDAVIETFVARFPRQ